VYFFNGRYDYTDPWELSEEYFQSIQSPYKEMVRFENSAHFPFLEEPVRFAQAMKEVRDKWRQSPMTNLGV